MATKNGKSREFVTYVVKDGIQYFRGRRKQFKAAKRLVELFYPYDGFVIEMSTREIDADGCIIGKVVTIAQSKDLVIPSSIWSYCQSQLPLWGVGE